MKLNKTKVEILRGREDLSVPALAEKAGVCAATIYNGYVRDIEVKCIGRIARALGVDIEDIIEKLV